MKNIITLTNVKKSYGELCVLDGYSLQIKENTALMGASGVGKTTLCRVIMGLERADSGKVSFASTPTFSAVFQEDRLFEDFDAIENICAVIGRTQQNRNKAAELLSALLIDEAEHTRAVRGYSGGMRRRVAIARALAAESDILILDEPYKGLDEMTRAHTAATIREKAKDKLIILITHDRAEASVTGIERIVTIE